MNLYLLEQNVNCDFDTYDSCVVCAENEHDAVRIHPDEMHIWQEGCMSKDQLRKWGRGWTSNLENIKCTMIGTAADWMEKGVVCASFNAG